MTIQKESILVSHLEEKLKTEFKTNFSLREFSVGYGIADLVFARNFIFDPGQTKYVPIISYDAFMLLNTTFKNGGPYSAMEVWQKNPHLSQLKVRKILRSLLISNYLSKDDFKLYQRNDLVPLANPISRTIAIEVKLSDAKNGIIQARRYKFFANECYLAILKENISRVDWTVLEQEDIGLISFDAGNSVITFERRPRRNNRHIRDLGAFAKELMIHRYSNLGFEL